MKRLSAVLALAALGAAAGALGQTYSQTPQSSAAPPASTSQQQATPSKADKEALMKDCLTKVTAANPSVSKEQIKAYCDTQVEKYSAAPK